MKNFRILFSCIVAVMVCVAASRANAQTADEIAIKQLLTKQTHAWNTGSIESYMHGYWQSDN